MPTSEEYRINKDYYNAYSKSPQKKMSDSTYYQAHKESIKKATNTYYKNHRDVVRSRHNRENAKIKEVVLTHYGEGKPACIVCGFEDIDCLNIDYINDNGKEHRKEIGVGSGNNFYKWLLDNDFPVGFQTLCANCNLKKELERRRRIRRGD